MSNQVIKFKAHKISEILIDNIYLGEEKEDKTIPIEIKKDYLIWQTPYLLVSEELKKTKNV